MTLHVSHLGASIALIEAADITPFITVKTVANNLKTLQVGMELKNTHLAKTGIYTCLSKSLYNNGNWMCPPTLKV